MENGSDRFDEGSGGGGFVLGLLTGTVLGAGLGILFAPKSGAALRSQLSEQAGNLANTASEGYRKATESAGEWAEKGKDLYGKAREAVQSGADEARRYVRETASEVASTATTSAAGSISSPSGGGHSGGSHSGSAAGSRRI